MFMVKFVVNKNRNNLVLFVHGFTGGKDTWKNSSGSYFFDMLADDEIVKEIKINNNSTMEDDK